MMKLLFSNLSIFLLSASINAQTTLVDSIKHFDTNDLLICRVDESIFQIMVGPFDNGENPRFDDERGLNLKTTIVNPKTKEEIYISDDPTILKLNIVTSDIILNTSRMIIEITGYVEGGWYGAGSQVHIYIGQRIDTVSFVYLSPSIERKIFYNGKELNKTIIVDTLSSFYLKTYVHVISEVGYDDHPRRSFRISGPIEKNSLLIFGLSSSYSEIFEIGKLLQYDKLKDKKENKSNELLLTGGICNCLRQALTNW